MEQSDFLWTIQFSMDNLKSLSNVVNKPLPKTWEASSGVMVPSITVRVPVLWIRTQARISKNFFRNMDQLNIHPKGQGSWKKLSVHALGDYWNPSRKRIARNGTIRKDDTELHGTMMWKKRAPALLPRITTDAQNGSGERVAAICKVARHQRSGTQKVLPLENTCCASADFDSPSAALRQPLPTGHSKLLSSHIITPLTTSHGFSTNPDRFAPPPKVLPWLWHGVATPAVSFGPVFAPVIMVLACFRAHHGWSGAVSGARGRSLQGWA